VLRRDEFWTATPRELWWLIEAKTPTKMYGEFTEDEAERLYRLLEKGR
jgi:hypothetical protein